MQVNLKGGVRSVRLDKSELRTLAKACEILRDLEKIDDGEDVNESLARLVDVRGRYEKPA